MASATLSTSTAPRPRSAGRRERRACSPPCRPERRRNHRSRTTASGRSERMILRLCHSARSSRKPPSSSVLNPLPRSPEKSIALKATPRGSTRLRSMPVRVPEPAHRPAATLQFTGDSKAGHHMAPGSGSDHHQPLHLTPLALRAVPPRGSKHLRGRPCGAHARPPRIRIRFSRSTRRRIASETSVESSADPP